MPCNQGNTMLGSGVGIFVPVVCRKTQYNLIYQLAIIAAVFGDKINVITPTTLDLLYLLPPPWDSLPLTTKKSQQG